MSIIFARQEEVVQYFVNSVSSMDDQVNIDIPVLSTMPTYTTKEDLLQTYDC